MVTRGDTSVIRWLNPHDLKDDSSSFGKKEANVPFTPSRDLGLGAGESVLMASTVRALDVAGSDGDRPDMRSITMEYLELAGFRRPGDHPSVTTALPESHDGVSGKDVV